jgi:DNA-damage-inducible protein J
VLQYINSFNEGKKMSKEAMIRARTDADLKQKVEKIFSKIGLTPSQAVNLFYSQVVLQKGLPFEVKIPNKTTLKAMAETEKGLGKKFNSSEELFADLEK